MASPPGSSAADGPGPGELAMTLTLLHLRDVVLLLQWATEGTAHQGQPHVGGGGASALLLQVLSSVLHYRARS